MSETEKIGQYEVVEQIGSGGMATVYKAYQPKLDRFVAIKVMHKSMLEDSSFLARFEREARIIARLDHPHIIPIYDYDEHDGQPYLVMKFVEGQTLKEILRETTLTLEEIQHIMTAVAEALNYAHQQGILHRDIKPSNIVIDNEGIPYLTDFGLARIATQGESTLSTDIVLGTPHYISPEQAQGTPTLDACTDVYSMGVILYELVTGSVPFTADTPYAIVHKHIYSPPPPPSQINPEVPRQVEQVLLRALAKEPSQRYRTPNALMAAFNGAVALSGLTQLDEERVFRASELMPKSTPRVPEGGKHVVVRVPVSDSVPPVPGSLREFMQEIGYRLRNTFLEIREEIAARNLGEEIKHGIQQIKDSPAISAKVVLLDKHDRERAKAIKLLEEDWGADESSIRGRAQKRINQRRRLVIHALIYTVIIAAMASSQGEIQASLETTFTDPDFISDTGVDYLQPLATINYTLFFALMWGGGLFTHALKVFYDSGRRLENKRRVLQQSLEDYHGPGWPDTITAKDYKRLRNRVMGRYQRRVQLMGHFVSVLLTSAAVFVVWGPILEVINASPDIVISEPWNELFIEETTIPVLVSLILGFTVIIHAWAVGLSYLVGSDARERAIQREIVRERELSLAMHHPEKRKDEAAYVVGKPKHRFEDASDKEQPAVRLTGDGEFTESFAEEIGELEDDQQHGTR